MLARFLQHHVLANLSFVLVLVLGIAAYNMLPREKDPTINFNWIQITTAMPGASAEDVEKLITTPLEDAVAKISDIRFISSVSRESVSSVLIRFNDVPPRIFDKRLNDLRREVQNVENTELPEVANSPFIYEITSASAFPTASLVLQGQANDEQLRFHGRQLDKDLERLAGIDRVDSIGLRDPELRVVFDPARVSALGLTPGDLADTVSLYFRDLSAGSVRMDNREVLLRLVGTGDSPGLLESLPVITARGEVTLGSLAEVQRDRERANRLVSYNGQPALFMSVFKKESANTLELVDRLHSFMEERNKTLSTFGLHLVLVDDQTTSTRNAIKVMETNAVLGLILVLLVTWGFLGSRISFFITIGIPFTLAGTFLVLSIIGQTLNNSILLGVVISLGMLVDDAVVVVEGMYYRLRHGMAATQAAVESLREVFAPVTTSVLTTMAAFMPLMLMPGILGQFMMVIPLVVTLALAISLFEAYWILPSHVIGAKVNFDKPSRFHHKRELYTHWMQVKYSRLLIKAMRYPGRSAAVVLLLFAVAIGALAAGRINVNFFAMESLRLFYINVEMPPGTPLDLSLQKSREAEQRIRSGLLPGEVRGMVSYAGIMFTAMEPLMGDNYAQVMVSLNPQQGDMRSTHELVEAVRPLLADLTGVAELYFFEMKDGPPTEKPIKVKVRGDDFEQIGVAVDALKGILGNIKGVSDISDNDSPGAMELVLTVNHDAVNRAGLSPAVLSRLIRMLGDGEVVSSVQVRGEKVEVRVLAEQHHRDLESLLRTPIALPDGSEMALGELVDNRVEYGRSNIRHHNLRRAITLEADLDKGVVDTVSANARLLEEWQAIASNHPGINLDFSGELDDINESLDSIFILFTFGLGLIYLILGTQFGSYFQPLLIIFTIPMALTGVLLGLWITGNPLSLYTLYGVVALGGIAVNAAIVLISAANARLNSGMSVLHATVYAARRRMIPIIITSLTTIAGLFSLATGLGGHSLIWGPVATAIVWGLAFSTVLTLFVTPMLYRFFMGLVRR
ncbi:MAG: efflux RND transporter permease subunit [Pseudomonadota bacterium]